MSAADVDISALAFEAVDTGLAVIDASGTIRGWNGWLARATSVPAERAIGHLFDDVLGITIKPRLKASIEQAISSGASSLLTHSLHPSLLQLKGRDGRALLHNVTITPLGLPETCCLLHLSMSPLRRSARMCCGSGRMPAMTRSSTARLMRL